MAQTDSEATSAAMTEVMEVTMETVHGRFHSLSKQLESKLHHMGARIHDMEKNVADLMTQAGTDQAPPSPGASSH